MKNQLIGPAEMYRYLRMSCNMTSSQFRDSRVWKRLSDTIQSCDTHISNVNIMQNATEIIYSENKIISHCFTE